MRTDHTRDAETSETTEMQSTIEIMQLPVLPITMSQNGMPGWSSVELELL